MKSPAETLRELEAGGLLRTLRPLDSPGGIRIERSGHGLWNFSSNDYLGLSRHPRIEEALIEGVKLYGAGSGAARLVSGTLPPHRLLEEEMAVAKQSDAALAFSSGYAAAIGTIPAIVGKDDFVILDKLSHSCLVDGAKLSGATIRVFPHNDTARLEHLLKITRTKHADARILVATESVFSMDGDVCPLASIVNLAEQYNALVMLDEAHGFGILGNHGTGLADSLDLQKRITFQMGTLSKAAGISGGYIAASRDWIDLLVNRARSFIFSTAPPPALAHAAVASLRLIQSAEGESLREKLRGNIHILSQGETPIMPWIMGSSENALAASAALEEAGFLVPAIRYPTVPRGKARLRISLSAAHSPGVIRELATALAKIPSA